MKACLICVYHERTVREGLCRAAIASGATLTVFSIVDAWLVRPLNFPEPDRLAIAFATRPERPFQSV
jgi:hypothetical protein